MILRLVDVRHSDRVVTFAREDGSTFDAPLTSVDGVLEVSAFYESVSDGGYVTYRPRVPLVTAVSDPVVPHEAVPPQGAGATAEPARPAPSFTVIDGGGGEAPAREDGPFLPGWNEGLRPRMRRAWSVGRDKCDPELVSLDPYFLLALFLGGFGAHMFYVGRKEQGVVRLLCLVPGFLLVVPAVGVVALGVAEAVAALMADRDPNGNILV